MSKYNNCFTKINKYF